MKKYFYNIMVMALLVTAAIGFSSCEDAEIAYTLEGTWRGNMYLSTKYMGYDYDVVYSEITFLRDPGAYSSGDGYWVDYYDTGKYSSISRDYVAYKMIWTVDFGNIKISFNDGSYMEIYDYHLDHDHFYGVLYDGGKRVDFDLVHTSSPNWNSNRYWGYDNWYNDDYYYSRTRSADSSEADSTSNEKPIRFIRGK